MLVSAHMAVPVYSATLDESVLTIVEGEDGASRSEAPSSKARIPSTSGVGSPPSGTPLTLAEVARVAVDSDPVIKAWSEKANALSERAEAASYLPNPKLKAGIDQYPTGSSADGYRLVLGVQQVVMPQVRRDRESAQMELMGKAQVARAENQKLLVLRELRKAWLNVFLQHHALVIVRQTQKLLAQTQQATQNQYRSGGGSQGDVLQAQVESSLLKDKESQLEAAREMALAELAKWAGPVLAGRTLMMDTVELPAISERAKVEQNLDRHPLLQAMKFESDSAKEGVEAVRARTTSPEWMFEFEAMWMNSKDSGLKSDAVSASVLVDLPYFKKNLQDHWLAASEKDYNTAVFLATDERRDLKRMLDQEAANLKRLDERLTFYKEVLLPQVAQNAQVALRGYQSQVAEFGQVMRARLMALDSKLEAVRLLVERHTAHVNILYLAGGGA